MSSLVFLLNLSIIFVSKLNIRFENVTATSIVEMEAAISVMMGTTKIVPDFFGLDSKSN